MRVRAERRRRLQARDGRRLHVDHGAAPDMFWGDRFGKLEDPYGSQWRLATHKEDVPPRADGRARQGRDGPDGAGSGSRCATSTSRPSPTPSRSSAWRRTGTSAPRCCAPSISALTTERSARRQAGAPDPQAERRDGADQRRSPYCQDTGFSRSASSSLGQDVHVAGGGLSDAINEGVARATRKATCARRSCEVAVRPREHRRQHAGGDPRGRGAGRRAEAGHHGQGRRAARTARSTRCSTPAAGVEGVKDFIIECVKMAGPDACPPLILGVGVGRDVREGRAELQEGALPRDRLAEPRSVPRRRWSRSCSTAPTASASARRATAATRPHSASTLIAFPATSRRSPVAVTIECHAHRHKEATL